MHTSCHHRLDHRGFCKRFNTDDFEGAAAKRQGTRLTTWQFATAKPAGVDAVGRGGGPFLRIEPEMKLRSSMTVGLAVGVTAAVVVACATGAYLYSVHHFRTLVEETRKTALAQGELIRVALEHQMLENDRSLIGRMIETFGKVPNVEQVTILDREGRLKFSSVPPGTKNDLSIGSATCQVCHQHPPSQRDSSHVIESRNATLLRTVIPFRNREACYRCHDSTHKINGILLLDINTDSVRATMDQDLWWMVGGTGLLMLLLVTAIGIVFRLVVIRRLRRFETTAREIVGGDLEQRVPADGSDTIAWLAQEFNSMADSMGGLVHDVRDQRQRLETVINSIDDGIVVLDPQRTVIAANAAFLKRTGQVRSDLLGSSCQHATSGMCGTDDCPTLACLESGQRQVRICERRTADGELHWEEVHSSPVLDSAGKVEQVVEVWRDISRRRAAEAQLAESHRLASLGMLASGFSHELNTPLATVLTCVEGILRSAPQADSEQRPEWAQVGENARIAREQLLRCRGITQHFLRLSSGKGSPLGIVDVARTCEAVVRLIAPTAQAQSTTIVMEPIPPGISVRVNEAELQHVLLNLLLNAIEASGTAGEVRLQAEGGHPVRIRVIDNGCGIAPEDQRRIFEPFFSLRKGGTGLGLYLSLYFLRHWGGEITVKSTLQVGSTFEVTLPAASASPRLPVHA